MADQDDVPRGFPGGHVPIIGEVVDDGQVRPLPSHNGLSVNSMADFSKVFPYDGPPVNVVVRRKRRRR